MDPDNGLISCLSCGAPVTGKFCAHCGEKRIDAKKDFAISKFTEQVIDGFTHFDTKVINTFRALFFKPGLLTANYIKGIRVKFMKPVQLFIVAGVLFYLFMPDSASFYAGYEQLQYGYQEKGFSPNNPVKYNINKALVQKAKSKLPATATVKEIEAKVNDLNVKGIDKTAGRSKTFLFLILPFWALFAYLLFYGKQPFYVPHVIFAAHVFSFFMLLDMLFLIFYFDVIGVKVVYNSTHLLPFFVWFIVYVIFAVRRVYEQTILNAVWKGLLLVASLLLLVVFYRVFITMWTINGL
jgi:Protein of unknown function (DUF3667)